MKKLLLITIILLLQSFPSFGEWEKIGEYDIGSNSGVIFIEVDTMRKKGDLIYYNILNDFYEPYGSKSSLSELVRSKMNCKTKEYQTLRTVEYKNSMGKGDVTFEMDFRDLNMIWWMEGSVIDLHYKYICR